MPGRTLWKAQLALGKRRIPVDLLAAVIDRDLHLHLLAGSGKRHARVHQQMVDPSTGEPVAPAATRRGIEVDRGRYVLLAEAEIEALEPKPSRHIELLAFVPAASVDPTWYDRPYYLAAGRGHAEECAALIQAMQKTGLDGYARWTMRKRAYAGVLHVRDDALMLLTLRSENQLLAAELPAPEGRQLDAQEMKLASELVGALSGPFEPEEFRDEYRDRVLEIVARKKAGKRVQLATWRTKPVEDDSVLDALRRSLKSAG